jgi:hypothetical protein
MKTYIGQRPPDDPVGDCRVFVMTDGDTQPLALITRHANSFEWGYAGSGPATTALSILTDYLGNEPDRPLYQRFKFAFLATAPHAGFTLSGDAIAAWLAEQPDGRQRTGLEIQTGFQAWSAEPARARSPEVDYGCWWWITKPTEYPHWRVSFIVDTGEVYAVALAGQRPDQYIVLGRLPGGRDAMETAMRGWAEGEMRLPDLLGRFE